MEEEVAVVIEPEQEAQPDPKEDVKPKSKSKSKAKVRDFETLHSVEPHRMTPEEMKRYIKELRVIAGDAENRADSFKQLSEASFNQQKETQKELDSLRHAYTTKMNYIVSSVGNLSTSINLIVKGGNN